MTFGFPAVERLCSSQFKLSDYLRRRNALRYALLGRPYYRMHLRPPRHSAQHRQLMELERSGHAVFYAAPEFFTSEKLNRYFLDHKVTERTAFFSPLDIGPLPDNDEHCVVFVSGGQYRYVCSEPRQVPRSSTEDVVGRAKDKAVRELSAAFYRSLSEELISIYAQSGARRGSVDAAQELLDQGDQPAGQVLRYLARNLFDCEVLVVPAVARVQ